MNLDKLTARGFFAILVLAITAAFIVVGVIEKIL